MRMSRESRNWSEFSLVLEKAKKLLPDRWELPISEVMYWHALNTEESKQLAMRQLRALEKSYPDNVALLGQLVQRYQQFAAPEDANRLLEKYDKVESNNNAPDPVRAALLVQQGKIVSASQLLDSESKQLPPAERKELQQSRVRLLASSSGQFDQDAQKAASADIADWPREQ